jgi:hypothetical protein
MTNSLLQQFTCAARPEGSVLAATHAILSRRSFSRRLTSQERVAVAVAGTAPTHLLTIDSAVTDRAQFAAGWRRVVKRLARLRQRSRRPLIHVATIARSGSGGGGYHLHALLWNEYLHHPVLGKHCREAGLGGPNIQQLPAAGANFFEVLRATTYVLGQHEALFGSDHHRRHRALPPCARSYLAPQSGTLAAFHPELLAALGRATDRSVTDDELVAAVPLFSSDNGCSNKSDKSCSNNTSLGRLVLNGHGNMVVERVPYEQWSSEKPGKQ